MEIVISIILSVLITYSIVIWRTNKKLGEYRTVSEALTKSIEKLANTNQQIEQAKEIFVQLDAETQDLQVLRINANDISLKFQLDNERASKMEIYIKEISNDIEAKKKRLHDVQAMVDLYSRLEDFVEQGLFEMPDYLYETSARFTEEIKQTREKQKFLIKNKNAITYPSTITLSPDTSYNSKVLDGQVKLMLTAFNIECDLLISKVGPGNYPRTLERIEKLANQLEKSAATLHCGFNLEYIEHKYQECQLQYQFKLKKKEEQEEQREIREQIMEEQKAIREFEKALAEAEREEQIYRDMLEKARAELGNASNEDRLMAEQRIIDLEMRLAEAEEKEQRAKSMAEQTRKGHVYIISNIGSFGENVYKIGLTRRLDPLDRVKELGDASVPFSFDVHAMIYVDDAPALETSLHREFSAARVNAVNLRKEFFRTDLTSIKQAVERITNSEADFKMTILAEEFYETRRLQGVDTVAA